eukprot:m.677107 g.677107  ORF g.677107 m.677107 type:complete len:1104 (-) comp22793_c0_seq11:2588-5899(-)
MSQKRARVNENGDGVTTGHADEEENGYSHKAPSSAREDNGGADSATFAEDVPETRATNGTGSTQCAGVLKSVFLERFMSHRHLHMELGKHVTFITGKNGTGKSAILTSIIVGLGGKVASTGKEKSTLFSLVQRGATEGTIVIELHNQGADAFEHEKYGDVIRVERKIRQRGSTVRLLNGSNNEISRAKIDLNRMLDQFNIQVENPMAVLNQEMSKAFMTTVDPASKYKQFARATQLDQIQRDYVQVGESLKQMAHSITRQNNRIEVLKNAACAAEKKYAEARKLENIEAEIHSLEHQATWAKINELKTEEEKQVDMIRKIESDSVTLEENKVKYEERISSFNEEIDARKKQINEAEDATKKMQARHEELRKVRRDRTRIESERKQAEKQKRKCEKDLQTQRQNLETVKATASSRAEEQREERRRAIEDLENQLQDAQQEDANCQKTMERTNADMDSVVSRIQELEQRKSDFNERRRELDRELRKSERGQTNRLELYGADIVNLCEAIKRDRWHGEVVGPLGLYVEPIENMEEWTTAIEASIGMMVRMFAVTDARDRKKLDALAGKHRARITIINKRAEPRYSLPDRIETGRNRAIRVEDAIRVANDLVYNILVDNSAIHQVVLCERREDAREIAMSRNRNFKKAFMENGDRFEPGGNFYATTTDRGGRLLQRDMASTLGALKQDIAALHADCTRVERELQSVVKEKQQLERDLRNQRKKLDGLGRKIHKLEGELQHLRNEDEDEDDDVNYAEMEEELSQTEVELQQSQIMVQDAAKRELAKRQEEKPLQEAIAAEEAQLKAFTAEHDRLCDEINEYDRAAQKAAKKMQQCQHRLDDGKRVLKECETDIRILTEKIEEETAAAQQLGFGEQPELKAWSSTKYRNRIESLRKSLREKEKTMGSINDIRAVYERAKSAYDAANSTLLHDIQFEKEMREVAVNRRDGFSEFRDSIVLKSKWNFKELLAKKGFFGSMKFDHEAQTLILHVDTKGRNTKTVPQSDDRIAGLSGGERSFTMSCFIISLWEAIDCPFRCLDEFDVFMDEVNRKIAVQMLVDAALMAKNRQHVFLSPLSVRAATNLQQNAAFIKVMRMPDKGQQTITQHVTN